MIVMPFYFLPFIPIILAPIFINLSDLGKNQKLFYSLYPLVLYFLVYLVFYQKTRKPRSITFVEKGWYSILYNVKNEPKLKDKNGYREISFSRDPILLTSTKQMDIIPISDSKYYYKKSKNQEPVKILYDSDVQTVLNEKDTSLYIYFEVPEFDSTYCFNKMYNDIKSETFFVGTIQEYLTRDALYPISQRNQKENEFFKSHCKKNYPSTE